MPTSDRDLLDAALEAGLLTGDVLRDLSRRARRERRDLVDLVLHTGRFPRSALYQALADSLGLEYVDIRDLAPDPAACRRLPDSILVRRGWVPLSGDGDPLVVATHEPNERGVAENVARLLGREIEVAVSDPDAIASASHRISRGRGAGADTGTSPADATGLLERLLDHAWLTRASDVHLEPTESGSRIRFRIDGRLQEYSMEVDGSSLAALVSRVKILAGLDIAEQREPQDGGLKHRLDGVEAREFDIRVATIPTRWGERVTMRILGQETSGFTLEQLGMESAQLRGFRRSIRAPHGLLLITGPTGSGKSTTLYSALQEIGNPELNVMTVEDPIEFSLPGVAQVQVSSKVGFPEALRSFLRHDPDVLMVGEIRDAETADVAIKAAMTGHLVFSTLHTNDSPSAISRLLDIGAERFLLADTLLGVVAQRLVRRLCALCKVEGPAKSNEMDWLGEQADGGERVVLARPRGCPACLQSGYRGRVGIYEALWVDGAVSKAIHAGADERGLLSAAKEFSSLRADAVRKVRGGLVDLAEVRTVVGSREG